MTTDANRTHLTPEQQEQIAALRAQMYACLGHVTPRFGRERASARLRKRNRISVRTEVSACSLAPAQQEQVAELRSRMYAHLGRVARPFGRAA